jgi:hypothetical protein
MIIASAVLLLAAGSAVLVAEAADGSKGPRGGQFVGYWMGIDPLDGGDSRRGITRNDNGTFSLIGRDTVFTLCDETDRAVVVADDFTASGSSLASDDVRLTCTNNGNTLVLRIRYDVVEKNIIHETVTSTSGDPIDEIVFHRVSET